MEISMEVGGSRFTSMEASGSFHGNNRVLPPLPLGVRPGLADAGVFPTLPLGVRLGLADAEVLPSPPLGFRLGVTDAGVFSPPPLGVRLGVADAGVLPSPRLGIYLGLVNAYSIASINCSFRGIIPWTFPRASIYSYILAPTFTCITNFQLLP